MSNPNAPYIREIVDRSRLIGGTAIQSQRKDDVKKAVLQVFSQQAQRLKQCNDRKKTY
ncbi:hypothetical protein [Histophilus somni]|uniref:Uncharacterized protein n=1 Tax=Histophilus somni TaxID=731 RepID=A0A9Q6Z1D8_HISSO|nr:hypothetical protein [Histophilus somni]QQF76747.1 hypothetical protein JFL52_07950 [Histophilus somni]QQF79148.1 hypothetical protein JFL53_02150 [Histophilus somni]QQF82740.1 hypothetical protein JFL49_02135 [Histophilus somni]QQF90655.1 hypothetical protein JFL57_07960 [Histophilus somni]